MICVGILYRLYNVQHYYNDRVVETRFQGILICISLEGLNEGYSGHNGLALNFYRIFIKFG